LEIDSEPGADCKLFYTAIPYRSLSVAKTRGLELAECTAHKQTQRMMMSINDEQQAAADYSRPALHSSVCVLQCVFVRIAARYACDKVAPKRVEESRTRIALNVRMTACSALWQRAAAYN
jgi:hypothetical protein